MNPNTSFHSVSYVMLTNYRGSLKQLFIIKLSARCKGFFLAQSLPKIVLSLFTTSCPTIYFQRLAPNLCSCKKYHLHKFGKNFSQRNAVVSSKRELYSDLFLDTNLALSGSKIVKNERQHCDGLLW
jgi:hypothetical protein